MVLERDPPLTRSDINETQLRMLQRCETASLLPLEVEEFDGRVVLRYALDGTRMLAEAARASRWTMGEMMEALCRLADTLEECRMIMLDVERVRLEDEFIFAGNEIQDLRFTYVPLILPPPNWKEGLEKLIVRWMMRVREPDGPIFQQVLRLVTSTDFVPAALGRLGKQYLAEAIGGEAISPLPVVRQPFGSAPKLPEESGRQEAGSRMEEQTPRGRSWDLLQPISGDLRPVSELWGEAGQVRFDEEKRKLGASTDDEESRERFDPGRWRIIVVGALLLLLAFTWKFIYLDNPGQRQLLIGLCATLFAGAAALLLWNGPPGWASFARGRGSEEPGPAEIEAAFRHPQPAEEAGGEPGWTPPGFAAAARPHARRPAADDVPERGAGAPETAWIAGQDRTALLDKQASAGTEAYCLVWKSGDDRLRIPLRGDSLVIGRSGEAVDHVDETNGVSRAHVEFVRVSAQWKVKDLGSRNGSRINDQPMAPYELYPLQPGDCVTLARSEYRFQLAEEVPGV